MIKTLIILSNILFAVPVFAALDGVYTKPCYDIEDDILSTNITIANNTWTLTHTAYEDNRCETPYLIYEVSSQLTASGENVDLTTTSSTYTSLSDVVSGVLNQIEWCGFSDWQTNVTKNVSGKICADFVPPQAGEKTFTKAKVTEQGLYIGTSSKGFDGKTSTTRFTKFEDTPYLKSK